MEKAPTLEKILSSFPAVASPPCPGGEILPPAPTADAISADLRVWRAGCYDIGVRHEAWKSEREVQMYNDDYEAIDAFDLLGPSADDFCDGFRTRYGAYETGRPEEDPEQMEYEEMIELAEALGAGRVECT